MELTPEERLERDRFLCKLLNICTHDNIIQKDEYNGVKREYWYECKDCGEWLPDGKGHIRNFSMWQSYGLLWDWIRRTEHWISFKDFWCCSATQISIDIIASPDAFANAVYEYFKDNK